MAGRLTRFLNLERRRPSREEPAHDVVTPGRFTPESSQPAEPAQAHPVMTPGRFDPPQLQLSPDHGEQPFLRCPSCEADNGRFAVRCLNCSARLDTQDVQAFNERLWEQRRTEAEAAKATEQSHQQEQAADLRQLGEAIARNVAERERARLGSPSSPLGIRWLAQLDEERRLPAALGALALFAISVLVVLAANGHPALRLLGGAVAASLMWLFLPKRRRFWD